MGHPHYGQPHKAEAAQGAVGQVELHLLVPVVSLGGLDQLLKLIALAGAAVALGQIVGIVHQGAQGLAAMRVQQQAGGHEGLHLVLGKFRWKLPRLEGVGTAPLTAHGSLLVVDGF
jgi:hypothetical protein